MLEQIMVPLDGSEFGEQALPFARALSLATGAAVNLSHVSCCELPTDLLQNTPFQYEGVDLSVYEAKHQEAMRQYLKEKEAALKAELPDRRICSALLEGWVTEALERHAREIGAQLIVMTTHGRTGMSRAWLGSVADSLVRHSHFPLLLIRPLDEEGKAFPSPSFRHLLVPLDGSVTGEGVLPTAVLLARSLGSRVTLFHVVSPFRTVGARPVPLPAGDAEERRRRGEDYLAGVAKRLQGEGVEVEGMVEVHASPARAILEAVERQGTDLVAMATHGYRGMKRAVLGSVADKVLRGCTKPLLLVRPPEASA